MTESRLELIRQKLAEAIEVAPSAGPDEDIDDGQLPEIDGKKNAEIDWKKVRLCAEEPANDIGNSRRLRLRFGDEILHVQNIEWYVWDGKRWGEDVDQRLSRPMAHHTVEQIAYEPYVIEPTEHEAEAIEAAKRAAEHLNSDEAPASEKAELKKIIARAELAEKALHGRKSSRRRFAIASGNSGKLNGMMEEAKAYLSVAVEELDADPLAFNVENGTLRFVSELDPDCPDPDVDRFVWSVRVDPHRREDRFSKLAPVVHDPAAKAPLFDEFLSRILPKREVREAIQRYFGYGMTGWTREQVFAFFHGEGRNGKSTLVDICCRVMGEYTTTLPISTLVGNGPAGKGGEATPDLARLPGARFVRTAEPKEGLALNEEIIKTLTSDEPVPIRRLHKEFNDIYPQFNLVISANRKPPIKGNDDGIWRRVALFPFDIQIPRDEIDKALRDKLWAERSGILNWLIAGALDYLSRGGLDLPDEVIAATQEYRDESDPIGAFVNAALTITGNHYDQVTPGDLYKAYETWCESEAETPFRPSTFNRRMPKAAERAGFHKQKSSTTFYVGVEIKPDFRPPSRTQF